MTDESWAVDRLAEQVRTALQSADLEAYRELLDPDVTWGPPDDLDGGCRNREEVLGWYRRGQERGIRADVTETVTSGDKILVGLRVHATTDGDDAERWQLLTVVNGRVKDIRGFDSRREAAARLG